MVDFRLERTVPLSQPEAWRRITHWPGHGAVVPLTRVRALTPPPTREGTVIVARTGIGPLGFDDPMEVTLWRPPTEEEPGRCRLEKRGRVVLGWAELETRPGPGGRTKVVWHEEIGVRHLPRAAGPLLAASARTVFGRALNSLLRTPL
ncbi:SRPBCC family protein [Streptomyces sp. NPDC057413]|uniref:SRPBCC family protein n=1 Tax=Streptomyces sp. NPDC057413 TaxID=3346124 RepID=UPI0036A99F03